MQYNLSTVELLELLDKDPTLRGVNADGHSVELRGERKEIIHRKFRQAIQRHITLQDRWRIIEPISYEIANDLFKRLRTIECRFEDGSKRFYNKLLDNTHVIIESGLPQFNDCLYYCLTYNSDGEAE
jgi:hypothetical protein